MDSSSVVYHASSVQELKEITPHVGTHGMPWVYATRSKVLAAIFLAKTGDYMIASGTLSRRPYIYERFPGAFQKAYSGKSGSIYTLSAKNFEEGKTSFKSEVVSSLPEIVLDEEMIDDVWAYIQSLGEEGLLQIYTYESRPNHIPLDDQDIVDKTVRWVKQFGERQLELLKEYHPHLVERVKKQLKE